MNFDALKLEVLKPLIPLPVMIKLASLAGLLVLLCVGYYAMIWMPLQDDIAEQKSEVENQRIILKRNMNLASDIPKKKEEYKNLQTQLKIALNMLPKKSQIPDLLENVSWAGKDSGLTFATFKPEPETTKSIYAEVPVSISVSGSYMQLLTFLKRVGEMPRIVNINNLSVLATPGNTRILNVEGKAVTYRFVDIDSKAAPRKSAKK